MEQPSKPAAEERHDARRHISPRLDRAVGRGAGRTTSADTRHHRPNATHTLHLNTVLKNPVPVSERALTRCELLPASTLHFHSGKLQNKNKKPCWTPRQHDTISNGNKSTHLKRLAAFAKASRSQKNTTSAFLVSPNTQKLQL